MANALLQKSFLGTELGRPSLGIKVKQVLFDPERSAAAVFAALEVKKWLRAALQQLVLIAGKEQWLSCRNEKCR